MNTRKILEGLKECCFEELSEDSCFSCVFEYCSPQVFENNYNSGATKMILFPIEAKDYVIKIPFSHDSYNFDEVMPFEGADEPERWNYCKAEELYYEAAEARGLDFVFLETKYIGEVHDHPIYCQKKVEMLDSRRSSHPKDWKSTIIATSYCNSKSQECFSEFWITDFLEYYGTEMLDKLYCFLDDFNISDLHEGNLGYLNDIPVIVDYAGYHE